MHYMLVMCLIEPILPCERMACWPYWTSHGPRLKGALLGLFRLSLAEGSLFVLVCFVLHVEISYTLVSPPLLFLPLESSRWVEVCRHGLIMWCKSWWILNNFFIKNLIKSKLNFLEKLGQGLHGTKKTLTSGISCRWFHNFLNLRWKRYPILNHFYHKKSIWN
jgi:hypothetical protein